MVCDENGRIDQRDDRTFYMADYFGKQAKQQNSTKNMH